MGKAAARQRGGKLRQTEQTKAPAQLTPFRIALLRSRQGCYGVSAGSFVAIPAAMLGEHVPALPTVAVMTGMALFAGAAGLLIEIVENRIFPGGADGS